MCRRKEDNIGYVLIGRRTLAGIGAKFCHKKKVWGEEGDRICVNWVAKMSCAKYERLSSEPFIEGIFFDGKCYM